MQNEWQEIGRLISKKREELSISLREIEKSTSIRSIYLNAIEKGEIIQFLPSVYAVGFVKQYVCFLKMNVDQLIEKYPRIFEMQVEEHEFAFGIGTLETRRNLSGGIKWLPSFLWASGITILFVLGYYFMKVAGVI